MSRFKLSNQAEQDLEDIWTYIAQESEQAADALIDEIIQRFPKLAAFPDRGRKRDDLLEGLHYFPVKSYVLFYRRTQEALRYSESFTGEGILKVSLRVLLQK